MRQLLTYCPPRMVSAKWTFQLSRSSTLASAAAMPPSAMTVCALPNSDLHTSPTETPPADASMAARKPAPPAPMTSTSCSCVSYSAMLKSASNQPQIRPISQRTHAHVKVAEADPEQAAPGPCHVLAIQAADAIVGLVASRRARQLVHVTADEMAK